MTQPFSLAGEGDSPPGERGERSPVVLMLAVWSLLFISCVLAPILIVVLAGIGDHGSARVADQLFLYCLISWIFFAAVLWRGKSTNTWVSACFVLAIAPFIGLAAM